MLAAAAAFVVLASPTDARFLVLGGAAASTVIVADARRHRTTQRELERLRASESRHRTLLASIPQHVIVKDADLVFRSVNRAVALDLGMTEAEVVGKTDHDLYPAELADAYRQADRAVMASREPTTLMEHNVSAVGDQLVEVKKAPIVEPDGRVSGVLILYEDVTDRVAAEEARRLLSSVVDSANDAIYTLTPDGVVRTWNAAAEELYGAAARQMIGRPMTCFVPEDRRDEFRQLLASAMSGERIRRHETTRVTARGDTLQVEISCAPITASDGSIAAVSMIVRDVTERRALLEQLRHAAYRDVVTGLPNRAMFVERLDAALRIGSMPVDVLFLDLDDFKLVNDRYGHPVGDELLTEVGKRLATAVRAGDLVARFGGDEFAVLILDAGEAAMHVANRVCRSFGDPFSVGGRSMEIGASIGVAGRREDGTVDAAELLRRADVALYDSKREGKGRVRSFRGEAAPAA